MPLAATLLIAACGGGGSGGGGSSPGYTVGGNVTGLVVNQLLTLQDNGTDPLILQSDGAFTFSSKVPSGGNYSVTIAAQPTGGTCVVSHGSGTNVTADVSNVTVTCSADSYSLGGSLVGLAGGQQVTLENNGADSFTLTANGAFSFPTQVAYGSTYSITVSTQPSQASQQFCNVHNGTGIMSGAVTNVQVACDTELVLYAFTGAGGDGSPNGRLLRDAVGNLYGTSAGTVFELSPAAGGGYTESVLYSTALAPSGGVIMDGAGNLYGTTQTGGSGSFGFVFKLTPAAGGYTESVLHAFDGSSIDGGEPNGPLIMDSAGNLYGTTRVGGMNQTGIVFELSPAAGGGYAETILYTFSGGGDGAAPEAGLIMDGAGNLYGTTSGSLNSSDFGAVFKLMPAAGGGYTEQTLHVFTAASDGAVPAGGLIMDSAGNLYGTTRLGSGNSGIGLGTVFKVSSSGGNYSVLYSFTGGIDGEQPVNGLVVDSAGNLYGTTDSGGGSANCNNGCGTVFELSPAGGRYTESLLFGFSGGSGGAGPGALIIDAAGNLYGTSAGATNAGNVFEILQP